VETKPADPEQVEFEWPVDLATRHDPALQRRLGALSVLYRERKFGVVADSLALLTGNYPDETQFRLLRGISLFQDRQYAGAIQELSPLAAGAEPPSAALWFLALAYLEQQQLEPAKAALQKLIDRPHDKFQNAAKELWPSLSP
jgi:hypothetical protein